jgi:hypothetical protein
MSSGTYDPGTLRQISRNETGKRMIIDMVASIMKLRCGLLVRFPPACKTGLRPETEIAQLGHEVASPARSRLQANPCGPANARDLAAGVVACAHCPLRLRALLDAKTRLAQEGEARPIQTAHHHVERGAPGLRFEGAEFRPADR